MRIPWINPVWHALWLMWVLLAPCSLAASPDRKVIQQWLGATPERIETIIAYTGIRLRSGEPAQLLTAEMDWRGYHERNSYILVRPRLHQARLLKQWDSEYAGLTVFALNGRVSGVMVGMDVIAQGVSEHRREFVYFDGWRPIRLYARAWSANDGICEDVGQRCVLEEVRFRILDGRSPVVILETVRRGSGKKLDSMQWKTAVNDIPLILP